ncbi:MAG: hypothetical protein K6F79_08105 [Saccharofermentans sp.]|nr:hypothetical protein [Saccharofermentans sp.]
MKVYLRKLTASALSVAMIASLSGCAMLDKADDAVLDAADDYASAVTKFKASDILELVNEPSDDFSEGLEGFMDHSTDSYGADYDAICAAIEGTFSYEIDEESVESSKKNGTGSVDITFSYVDYQAVYDSVVAEGGDVDAFVDALGSGDKKEVTQTVDFVLVDDAWLVDDEEGEGVQELYQFYLDAFDFQFSAPLADLVDYTEWWYSEDGIYYDTYTIELDIIPTAEGQEVEWEFYYEIYLDGELVYTSDTCTDQGAWIESYYGTSYNPSAETTSDGCLVEGTYECIVYDTNGTVLADSSCEVINGTAASTTVPVTSGDLAEAWDAGVDEYWYSYSDGTGYGMGSGDYTTDETIIEFTCSVIDEDTFAYMPVYYEVYYSADGNTDNAECVYSATITPKEYSNGFFYEFQYVDDSGLDAGTYFIVGATDENAEDALFSVAAEVT